MSNTTIAPDGAPGTTQDRLISAVHELWERLGRGGISARHISQACGVPVSSIYYHFGSLEQLFLSAQEAACDEAKAWCDSRLADIADAALPPEAFAAGLAAAIDDWTIEKRRLAFVWREGQLLAARDAQFRSIALRWRAVWTGFWQAFCGRCGLDHAAVSTTSVFEGESFLHLFRWRRTIDRAGLDEFARGWAAWMTGEPTPPSPWRSFARAEAIRGMPPPPERDAVSAGIARAAAAVVAKAGAAHLTHRAVATEAGMTLGVVSHKFRTSAELLHAAFGVIYSRTVAMSDHGDAIVPEGSPAEVLDDFAALLGRSGRDMAAEELFVAVARDPALNHLAAQLRYLRGRTSGRYLQALVGRTRPLGDLDAALFSAFSAGLAPGYGLAPHETAAQGLRRELDQVVSLLTAG